MNRKEGVAPMPARRELSDTPLKLCNEIARLFRAHMRATEGQDGVMSQPGAHLVLSTLALHDGINQRELVRQTHLRPPTVSLILKKMQSEGLVERRENPDDLRSEYVYLSEAGRALDRENIVRIQRLDAMALRGLEEREIALLMALLPKIRDNMLGNEINQTNEMQEDSRE